ncbi:MAG: hypothetical protein NTX50_25780 [Candidatus Sumerlaeota bacterium]|nr:hypothetical protein [Candidatus Sumerlaeota bacterium]
MLKNLYKNSHSSPIMLASALFFLRLSVFAVDNPNPNAVITPSAPTASSSAALSLTAVAYGEMQTLADAETWVAIDINYYVSLESLDDSLNASANPAYNYIMDSGGAPVLDLTTARFYPTRQNLGLSYHLWQGPYVTYQMGKTDDTNSYGYDIGTPLDPWYRPYYLFSPAGLVKPPMSITLDYYGDSFDKYTIVSFGPDGQFGGDDDLFYQFGSPPVTTLLTSVLPLQVPAGGALVLKGWNFGIQSVGNVQVLFNGAALPAEDITTWTTRLINIQAPSDAQPGTATLAMSVSGFPQAPSFIITIEPRIIPPTLKPSFWKFW